MDFYTWMRKPVIYDRQPPPCPVMTGNKELGQHGEAAFNLIFSDETSASQRNLCPCSLCYGRLHFTSLGVWVCDGSVRSSEAGSRKVMAAVH